MVLYIICNFLFILNFNMVERAIMISDLCYVKCFLEYSCNRKKQPTILSKFLCINIIKKKNLMIVCIMGTKSVTLANN